MKKKKGKISVAARSGLITLFLAFAVLLSGCANEIGDDMPNTLPRNLDPAIEAQMKQDWQAQFGFPLRSDAYLGTFDGAVVMFMAGDDASIRIQVIAGVTFTHSLLSEIFVWKEGVFFTLQNAYQENILTQENIVAIGNTFNSRTGDDMPNTPPQNLDTETRLQIKQDYFNQLIQPLDPSVQFEALEIEHEYGVFDGYIVVRFNSVIVYPAMIIPIEIGGVVLDWVLANRIIAWKDGQVFTLISAQENNILTQESLRAIALIHNPREEKPE